MHDSRRHGSWLLSASTSQPHAFFLSTFLSDENPIRKISVYGFSSARNSNTKSGRKNQHPPIPNICFDRVTLRLPRRTSSFVNRRRYRAVERCHQYLSLLLAELSSYPWRSRMAAHLSCSRWRTNRRTLQTDAFRLRYCHVPRLIGTAAVAAACSTADGRYSAPIAQRSMSAEVTANQNKTVQQ